MQLKCNKMICIFLFVIFFFGIVFLSVELQRTPHTQHPTHNSPFAIASLSSFFSSNFASALFATHTYRHTHTRTPHNAATTNHTHKTSARTQHTLRSSLCFALLISLFFVFRFYNTLKRRFEE